MWGFIRVMRIKESGKLFLNLDEIILNKYHRGEKIGQEGGGLP